MPLTSRADIINMLVPSNTDLTVEDVWVEPTSPPSFSDENKPSLASQPNKPSIVDKEKNLLPSNKSQATFSDFLALSLEVRVTGMTGKTSEYLCNSTMLTVVQTTHGDEKA